MVHLKLHRSGNVIVRRYGAADTQCELRSIFRASQVTAGDVYRISKGCTSAKCHRLGRYTAWLPAEVAHTPPVTTAARPAAMSIVHVHELN